MWLWNTVLTSITISTIFPSWVSPSSVLSTEHRHCVDQNWRTCWLDFWFLSFGCVLHHLLTKKDKFPNHFCRIFTVFCCLSVYSVFLVRFCIKTCANLWVFIRLFHLGLFEASPFSCLCVTIFLVFSPYSFLKVPVVSILFTLCTPLHPSLPQISWCPRSPPFLWFPSRPSCLLLSLLYLLCVSS